MKYAILSDLHANRDALDRVLADVAACGADTVVCLGDIVGYGPLPKETLERVRSSAAVVIATTPSQDEPAPPTSSILPATPSSAIETP